MGNICNFDEWKFINEKNTNAFNAEIKDIKKDNNTTADNTTATDNIVVKETDNSDPIVYHIQGTQVFSNQKEIGVGENGNPIGTAKVGTDEITDPQLKLDIKKAAYAIRDVKDRLYAKEILRLTGGDITDATDEIRNIIDNAHSTADQSLESNGKAVPSIKETLKNNDLPIKYVSLIDEWDGKYKLTPNDISNIYNVQSHTIGKGEYLLPFLYCDVYKNKAYGDTAKGDNYYMIGDEKYILELKGSGAPMSFSNHKIQNKNGIMQYLEKADEDFLGNPEKYNADYFINVYKTAIAASLLNYGKSQLKKYNGGYLCLFNENESNQPYTTKKTDKNTTPIGMLFINIGNLADTDIAPQIGNDNNNGQLGALKKIIDINFNDYRTEKDFIFKCIMVNGEYRIYCTLKQKYINKILYLDGGKHLQKKKGRKGKNDIKNDILNIYNDENFEESIILNFDRFINEIYTK